jgi:hypothetical protein
MSIDVSSIADILAAIQAKKFGRYKGLVIDNVDEGKRGRLLVKVKDVLGEEPAWMPGVFPMGGNDKEAFVFIPAKGSTVLVEFIGGDVSFPIWTGTYWDEDVNTSPPEPVDMTEKQLSLVKTRSGAEVRVTDDGEKVTVRIGTADGTEFSIDERGKVRVVDKRGAGVVLDPEPEGAEATVTVSGHGDSSIKLAGSRVDVTAGETSITMDAGTVTIAARTIKLDATQEVGLGQGANAPLLNAQTFIAQYGLHAHPSAAGPTGPATPPMTVSTVKLLKVKGI